MLVEGSASSLLVTSLESGSSGSVTVEGSLVESLVGAVSLAVPEAPHVVEAVGRVEASASLVEPRGSTVEPVTIASLGVAEAAAEANTTLNAFFLLWFGLWGKRYGKHCQEGDQGELKINKKKVV